MRVALDTCPIASDGVTVEKADWVEDAGPKVLERTRGAKGIDANQVKHEDRSALQVDDKDLARESGDKEKKRTQKENLEDDDGKELLQIPGKMLRANTGVVSPRSECGEKLTEEQTRKGKNRRDKRAGPTATEVSKLRDGFGEEYLGRPAGSRGV